ncbi:MAG TPA: CsgE family curli-type amyloid fiber assembly protein [Chryseosolibacter sp.]
MLKTSLLILLFFASAITFAQKADSVSVLEQSLLKATDSLKQNGFSEIEIGQLILDQTFSKAGNDFQQLFNTNFVWPENSTQDVIITIVERPSMANSTIIELSINEIKVFESFVQPRYDAIEELSMQAMQVVSDYLLNYDELTKQLAGEEMSGSGIY